MSRSLPLRENPVYQLHARGGCHASWRRWHRSPAVMGWTLVGLYLFSVALASVAGGIVPVHHVNLGGLIVVSYLITLLTISAVSRPLSLIWKRQQMTDLLMTPLPGAEMSRGILRSQLLSFRIFLIIVIPISGVLLLITLPEISRHQEVDSKWWPLITWAIRVFYLVSQLIWVAGVTWAIAIRTRSVMVTQAWAMLCLIIAVPLVIGVIQAYAISILMGILFPPLIGQGGSERSMLILRLLLGDGLGLVIGGGLITLVFQVPKLLIGWLLIRSSHRQFTRRMHLLMERAG